jgi:predicted dehydrogenase
MSSQRPATHDPIPSRRLRRRAFLSAGGLGAVALTLPAALRAGATQAPGDNVRMGFIGVGGRGSTHLRNILETKGVEVTWVCDIDPTALDRAATTVAQKAGKKPSATEHHDRVLAAKDVDAVLIATPCDVHARLYLDTIRAGKDLYVEKPLCLTVAEANAIVDAAASSKSVVQVGFQSRYSPGIRDGIARVHRGDLGEIFGVRAAFLAPFGPLRGWFSKRARSGDWMVEQAVHHWDIMNWALGGIAESAYGRGRTDVFTEGEPDRDVHDDYAAIIQWPKGVQVDWLHTWLVPKGKAFSRSYIQIVGRKGTVDLLNGDLEYMDASRPAEKIKGDEGNVDMTRLAHQAFLECVRARTKPFSNVENGRDAVLVGLLVREAVYGRMVVSMEEIRKQG